MHARLVERQVDLWSRPIFLKSNAGQFLLGNKCKRAVRRVLDHIAQMDDIDDAPDRRRIKGIVGPPEHGLRYQFAVEAVLREQACGILGKPFQRVPVLVAFRGIHAAAVAEARHSDHMSFHRRQRASEQLAPENASHRLERVEDPLQHGRAIIAVGGGLVARKELGNSRQRGGVVDRRCEIENVSEIHVAGVPAKKRKGIALGHRCLRIGSQGIEAALDALQHDQIVIGAQCAEFGRHLVNPFAELVEGMRLARKLDVVQFQVSRVDDLARGGPRARLA